MLKNIINITLAVTAAAVMAGCVENRGYYSDSRYQQRSNRYNAAPPSTTSGFYMGDPVPPQGYRSSTSAPPSTTAQPAPAPVPAPAPAPAPAPSDNAAPPSTTSSSSSSTTDAPPSSYSSS